MLGAAHLWLLTCLPIYNELKWNCNKKREPMAPSFCLYETKCLLQEIIDVAYRTPFIIFKSLPLKKNNTIDAAPAINTNNMKKS